MFEYQMYVINELSVKERAMDEGIAFKYVMFKEFN